VPPKNVFALERTYLAWIHMAITVGAVAAALVGVAGGSSPRGEKVRFKQWSCRRQFGVCQRWPALMFDCHGQSCIM
jgi:Domain of unknown function (DUF202)